MHVPGHTSRLNLRERGRIEPVASTQLAIDSDMNRRGLYACRIADLHGEPSHYQDRKRGQP